MNGLDPAWSYARSHWRRKFASLGSSVSVARGKSRHLVKWCAQDVEIDETNANLVGGIAVPINRIRPFFVTMVHSFERENPESGHFMHPLATVACEQTAMRHTQNVTVGFNNLMNYCSLSAFNKKFMNFRKLSHTKKMDRFLNCKLQWNCTEEYLSIITNIFICKIWNHSTIWIFSYIIYYLVLPCYAEITTCILLGILETSISNCYRDTWSHIIHKYLHWTNKILKVIDLNLKLLRMSKISMQSDAKMVDNKNAPL